MDQVRKVLGWLKQNHFWVLSVLIVLISLFCWWSGSGAMSKLYKDAETKISGGFQQVDTLLGDSFHPNEQIKEQQTKEYNQLLEAVAKLWQELYDLQSKGVLIWPSGPGELLPQFVETVEKLEFGDDIPDRWREHYRNYIFRHFPKLPEKIGARAIQEGQAGAAGAGIMRRGIGAEDPSAMVSTSGELEDDGNYICEWDPADQSAVRAELEFTDVPSPLRVWCTQENLWVYHTLLNVIKNTNSAANATRISNAAVRRVYSLQVGQTAAPYSRRPDRIYKLPTAAAAAGAEGEVPAGEPAPGGLEGGGAELGGGEFMRSGLAAGQTGPMSEEQERGLLLHGRYLGDDGKPIPYGAGGPAEAGTEAPMDTGPAGPLDLTIFGKEYKRLPVRMELEMDQRHLPRLIAECAKQPLQIEVQEVRVNAPDLLSGGGGAMTPRMSFSESGGMGGPMMPELTGLQQFNPHPEIATVAIQGVIYIFNKPDKELLAPPGDATDQVAQQQVQP
jgi:hypothetical protein